MPSKPPTNKTKTEPGLGGSAIPRMDSAEMKRVRDSFRAADETAESPESARESRPRLRDSVRREDPDDAPIQSTESITPNPPSSRGGSGGSSRAPENTRSPSTPAKSPSRRPSWEAEAPTGTRRKQRSGHPAVTVDNVGTTAVKLARKSIRESAPKLVASRGMIAKAPIDTRAAFVLSLVDGRNTTDSIVDMSGMLDAEVRAILDRLARLGLISLP